MRTLRRYWLAAVVAAAAAGPAVGQTTGTTGGSLGTSTSGTGANIGGGTALGSTGNTGNTGSAGQQGSIANAQLATINSTPPLLPPSKTQTSGSINQALNTSNYFGRYYGNPMYQGSSTVPLAQAAGGFGNVLYAVPGVTAVTTTGGTSAGGRGGATSSFGTRGSTTVGTGGLNLQDPGGQIVGLPRQIAYTATVKFQAPLAPPAQVAADLRGLIDRSTMIANPTGVQLLMDPANGVVVLRGAVRDEDEARTVEGMVRLTPGVQGVRNELSFPKP